MSASPRLPGDTVKAVGVNERMSYSPVTCAQVRKINNVAVVVDSKFVVRRFLYLVVKVTSV